MIPEAADFAEWMGAIEQFGALGVMAIFLAYQTWRIEQLNKELTNARTNLHDVAVKFAVQAEGTRYTLEGTKAALDRLINKVLGG